MDQEINFGDLRSLLNQNSTPQVWDQLCLWVAKWDDEESQARILPYIEGHLQKWSDAQRRVPQTWVKLIIEDKPVSSWIHLTRSLNLRGHNARCRRHWRTSEEINFSEMFKHEALKHLKHLDIGDNYIDDNIIHSMIEFDQLNQLEHLELQRNPTTPGIIEKLSADATTLSQLNYLGLRKCNINEDNLKPLLNSDGLIALKQIDLLGNQLNQNCIDVLSKKFGQHLEVLNLGKNSTLDKDAWHAYKFKKIHTLDLEQCTLGYEGAQIVLSRGPYKHLNLWHTHLEKFASVLEKHSAQLIDVVSLNVGKNQLKEADLLALCSIEFNNLETLNLYQCQLTRSVATALTQAPWLETLKELHIDQDSFNTGAKKILLDADNLSEKIKLKLK